MSLLAQSFLDPGIASGFTKVEHVFEAHVASVVGVRHILKAAFGSGIEEECQACLLPGDSHALENFQMAAVHGQDPVELVEIRRQDPPSTMEGKVVASPLSMDHRSRVGPLSHMVGMRSCGIALQERFKFPGADPLEEDGVGGG